MFLLYIENTLLSSCNVARGIRRLTERQLTDGYQLVNKINSTRDKLLVGADQVTQYPELQYSVYLFNTSIAYNLRMEV